MSTTATQTQAVIIGQFNGAFSRFQVAAYGDLKRAGLQPHIAHKIAFDYGSDIGSALVSNTDKKSTFATAVAKAKENKATLKISASMRNTNNSRTMSVVRACQQIADLFDENLFATRQLPQLSKELQEYVDECASWAKDREFVYDGQNSVIVDGKLTPLADK